MSTVRSAAVTGSFYPDDAAILAEQLQSLLENVDIDKTVSAPKAIIAPHAGYRYSGAIAAQAYARLLPNTKNIKRVILMGPCHRVGINGMALSSADFFETPLGRVALDKKAEKQILSLPQVSLFDPTHEAEHSLEVHIPFLQTVLENFQLVPIVVGKVAADKVAAVLEKLWGGQETLLVISSDLSHFLDYAAAQTLDARTNDSIMKLDSSTIESGGACGRFSIAGLLSCAKQRNMKVALLDLKNSGDTAGSKDRVVGYGAWAFYESKNSVPVRTISGQVDVKNIHQLSNKRIASKKALNNHAKELLLIANRAILYALEHQQQIKLDKTSITGALAVNGACFVTLKSLSGQLRGCIGSPEAYQALALDISANAYRAAFKDPRFEAITPTEYQTLTLSISILSPHSAMSFSSQEDLLDQLRPGIDGLVIMDGNKRALFLPSVWESLTKPEKFLAQLKRKAGMPLNYWSNNFKAHRFTSKEIKTSVKALNTIP